MDQRRSPHPGRPPHVCVVGAGISGLRCADVLLQQGFEVTILEGRDRIGGRVYQTRIPKSGHLVDIGANWIHGTEDNPILDLAKQTETLTHSWEGGSLVFDEDGNLVPEKETEEVSAAVWETVILSAFEHSKKNSASIDSNESLADYFASKARDIFPGDDLEAIRKRKLLLQASEMWGAFVGSPITMQSLKFFWLEECIEGENLFCASTYDHILRRIYKPAFLGADIKFLTQAIEFTAPTSPDGKVIIKTDWKERLEFDEVVITSPLGWLKRNQHVFEPSLPGRFCEAIDSLGYGCLEKVYISFPSAFWRRTDDTNEYESLSCQFLAPTYHRDGNPYHWIEEMFALSELPGPTSHPTILFYLFGAQSKALSQSLLSHQTPEAQSAFLLSYFKPYYSRLPNYAPTAPQCKPVGVKATNWLADDLAGNGSYCNFPIGLERGDEDIEILRHGLPDRAIWFAGEHTAPFVALGTVTGAYWSGEAVAGRIAKLYEMDEGLETESVTETGKKLASHL